MINSCCVACTVFVVKSQLAHWLYPLVRFSKAHLHSMCAASDVPGSEAVRVQEDGTECVHTAVGIVKWRMAEYGEGKVVAMSEV